MGGPRQTRTFPTRNGTRSRAGQQNTRCEERNREEGSRRRPRDQRAETTTASKDGGTTKRRVAPLKNSGGASIRHAGEKAEKRRSEVTPVNPHAHANLCVWVGLILMVRD